MEKAASSFFSALTTEVHSLSAMELREQRKHAKCSSMAKSLEGREKERHVKEIPSFRRRMCKGLQEQQEQQQQQQQQQQRPLQVPYTTELDDTNEYYLPKRRHRSGTRGEKVLSASWTSFCWTSPMSLLLMAAAALSFLSSTAFGLVIEEPFEATFDHVASAFGPDLLKMEPPVESRSLIKARPRDGCAPLLNAMEEGAIALVERGTCNFTQKVLHAQEAGASAVIVTDTRVTDQWLMVMYGDPENTQGIEIPSVLVSQATGERLWSNRSWIPGRQGRVRASLGASGHIVMGAPAMGVVEMLGIYTLLSVLLLAFSSICGLLFILAFTWYQRGYRTRALQKLKSFSFRRRSPLPRPSPLETQNGADEANGIGGSDSSSKAGGKAGAATVGAGSPSGLTPGGDPSVSSSSAGRERTARADSPPRRHPSTCGEEGCDNCGGGGVRGGAQDGAAGIGNGNSGNSVGDNGSDDDNRYFMRGAEDDVCAICLETYEDGDSLTGLPCRHSFHAQCIGPWLSGKSALCPMCKTEAFGKGGMFRTTGPMLEAAFSELASLCTENLAVLALFFLASVACGVVAAKLSLRD